MITEEQQEQAALHALGLLPADEAAAFEVAARADAELATLARELWETANHLALCLAEITPPAGLKERVLAAIAPERSAAASVAPAPGKIIALRPFGWVPWAIAAGLAVFCGLLFSERGDLRRELASVQNADPLGQLAVYPLGPAGEKGGAAMSIVWSPDHQSGRLDINGLPALESGKDYQLWAVDAGRKKPINAGLVKTDAKGHAVIAFKPDLTAPNVSAFAISVEPEGGSPQAVGPIIFVGTK